jgi:hypothetical protein
MDYVNNKQLENNILLFQKYLKNKKKFEYMKADYENHKQLLGNKIFLPFDDTRYEENNKKLKEVKDYLASEFFILAQNIVRFTNYQSVDVDDAIQEGVYICLSRVERFDPSRGSKAFNFLTTCLIHHLRQIYRSNKNFIELKRKYCDFIVQKHGRELPAKRNERLGKK